MLNRGCAMDADSRSSIARHLGNRQRRVQPAQHPLHPRDHGVGAVARLHHQLHLAERELVIRHVDLGPRGQLQPVVLHVAHDSHDRQVARHRDLHHLVQRVDAREVSFRDRLVDDGDARPLVAAVEPVEQPALHQGNPHRLEVAREHRPDTRREAGRMTTGRSALR